MLPRQVPTKPHLGTLLTLLMAGTVFIPSVAVRAGRMKPYDMA
jgi:hypothetical protein